MKKILLALLFCVPFAAHAGDKELVPSLSVTGYAEAKIAPDQATVSVNVYTENKELAVAKKQQDRKVKKLVALALKQGVKKNHISTHYANVQPLYDYIKLTKKRRFRAHSLTNRISIKMDDLEKVGPLVDSLVAAEFDRIQGVNFTLKNRRAHQEKLLKQALSNAKQKAEMMADALDTDIGRPLKVSESGSYNRPPVYRARGAQVEAFAVKADSGSIDTYTPTGQVDIKQTVNVTFELE